jgi:sugar lactone lactonase YvrE
MKKLLVLATLATALPFASAAAPSLVKKWETEPVLKTPESVLFDSSRSILYVSNIDGKEPWGRDGKGSIGKLSLDGKVVAVDWVSGLEAPKGMGLRGRELYVADLDQVVVIDVEKGEITKRISVEGAQALNDVTVDSNGIVYVSDSKAGKVHAIENGKVSLHLDGLKGLNGVLAHGGDLYVLADNSMNKVGADKTLTRIVDGLVGTADGLENLEGSTYVATCWRGTIHVIDAARKERHLVLDTSEQKIQAADLGMNAKERIIYVPTFFDNRVVAYEVR